MVSGVLDDAGAGGRQWIHLAAGFNFEVELPALEVVMRRKMKARQEVTRATAGQYRGASKKEILKSTFKFEHQSAATNFSAATFKAQRLGV